ncbi:MAG: protease SohB [Halopseudomonas yangmingensis]|uniref:Serine protease SohB n=1 Tax=Halopseudomonas yangmingensis TaxID=1720063 RepID=A0A1I4RMR1_9GAMM|nr:protease SohB [Halopseudomonas yangmingensis]SFM53479.1 serine protease SohB [Halopseudomonas yangmingensis]
MEWMSEYGLFLAKVMTVLLAVLAVMLMVAVSRGQRRRGEGELQVTPLNQRLERMSDRLAASVLSRPGLKQRNRERKRLDKAREKEAESRPRVYVLDFHGDIKASALEGLRHEITAVLELARPKDEILVRLESGGGMVHAYGLAAAQLVRVREAGIPLVVSVDKVAASGGYMMACIGDRILAAPFAMLGSIGVIAQLPNFNRLLKKHDVDFEMLTAGEYKRTLTLFGENTEKGREKFQQDLENIHKLFKEFVSRYRPELNVGEVATGEVWFGSEALERSLVDSLITSDQYISSRVADADLFEVHFVVRKRLQEKLAGSLSTAVDRLLLTWLSRLNKQYFH